MVIDSPEVQIARSTIHSYESFLIAIYLFNYAPELSLDEKKSVAKLLRDPRNGFWKRVEESTMKIPSPNHPRFKELFEAVGWTAGNPTKKLDQEILSTYKLLE